MCSVPWITTGQDRGQHSSRGERARSYFAHRLCLCRLFLALSVWTVFENCSRLEQKNLENLGYGKLSTQSKWCNGCSRKLVAQLVRNLSAMQETWVRSLGWEDPLEKGMATHSSILAWRIPWTVQSMGSQRVRYSWVTFTFILSKIKTIKGSLKCSEILVHFGFALMSDQRAGLRICKHSLFCCFFLCVTKYLKKSSMASQC